MNFHVFQIHYEESLPTPVIDRQNRKSSDNNDCQKSVDTFIINVAPLVIERKFGWIFLDSELYNFT